MNNQHSTLIEGACHCRNIRIVFGWPENNREIPARKCGCTFCQKHGGVWTSHRNAELNIEVLDPSKLSKYKLGTGTAEFYVCSTCGVAPFVTSNIEGNLYAVVNVNTFEGNESFNIVQSPADFDGESTDDRLDRRKRNWIPTVRMISQST